MVTLFFWSFCVNMSHYEGRLQLSTHGLLLIIVRFDGSKPGAQPIFHGISKNVKKNLNSLINP